jgi:hypothetical protein
MFWPDESIGVAAPMCVVGAMIARSDAIVITAPADAARAPSGETYTITGTGELSSSATMSSIELPRPPGVFSSITSAAACSLLAWSIESLTNDADTGLISLESVIAITSGRWPVVAAAAETGPIESSAARIASAMAYRARMVEWYAVGPARRWNSADVDRRHLGRAVRHPRNQQPAVAIDAFAEAVGATGEGHVTAVQVVVHEALEPALFEGGVALLERPQQIGQEPGPIDCGTGFEPK